MERKVIIEGNIASVTLTNLGILEDYEIESEEVYDESEIKSIMEEIDTYAQSGELDVMADVCRYNVMNNEDIEYLALSDEDAQEKEVVFDVFKLVNKDMQELNELLKRASADDVIYLRKEEGKAHMTFSLECEEKESMCFNYFDCSASMDEYDLLRESYYDTVCDTFLPETLSANNKQAVIDNFVFEPQIVYGELYKIVINEEGIKSLQKVELPGYYFQDEQRGIDE